MDLPSAHSLARARRVTDTLVSPRRFVCCSIILVSACRAAAIPEAQRYPAGTPFRAHYRTVDGTRLRLTDSGDGTPVVFIHGISASVYGWSYEPPTLVGPRARVV